MKSITCYWQDEDSRKGGVVCFVAFVVLLFTVVAAGVESKWEEEEPLLAYLIESGMMNQEMAELVRINCMHEVLGAKKILQDLELHFMEERSSDSNELLDGWSSSTKMRGMATVLLPRVNQILVDCIREKNFILPDTGEEKGSDTWYARCLGLLFNWRWSSTRRVLAQVSGEHSASSPTALAPSPAPTIPLVRTAVPASPPSLPFFPPDMNNSNLQPSTGDPTSASGSDVHSSHKEASKRTVIIAVAVTATVTFVIVALLFIFCRSCRGFGAGQGRNDESPLLSLSLSDYSIASSQKSFGIETSLNEEKLGNQSFHNKLNHNKFSGNFYMESHSLNNSKVEIPVGTAAGAATDSAENSLQMPPGMLDTPGLLPLKPPPGRTGPPKPPPPLPKAPSPPAPPSIKPSFGCPRPPPPPPRKSSSGGPRLPPPPPVKSSSDGPRPPPPPPVKPSSGGPRPPPPPPVKPSSGGPRPPPPPPIKSSSGGPDPPPPPPMKSSSGGPHPPPPPPINLSSGGPRPPPPGPPPPPPAKAGPRPPPPPSGAGVPPPRPPPIGSKVPRPVPPGPRPPSTIGEAKTKLKPFFWDKVMANPDHSMVWHQIKSGSFQFNEEMIESLFGYAPPEKNKIEAKKESSTRDSAQKYVQIIDAKKSQNLSILLKALNVTTEEVCDALEEGNELPTEFIQTLLKMAPTAEEELKLRVYSGQLSQLSPAERFLKVLLDIPFAFKRLEALLFMCSLLEETSMLKESFAVLEAACMELRKSRLFLKLLEAVLKTGNRMNDGTFRGGAQAFKLDTLLKLSDVKGTDGKTTLLHFVVQEIIRSEGIRAVRGARQTSSMSSFKSDDLLEIPTQDSEEQIRSIGLQVVSGLGNELENVKRAAVIDPDSITGTVAKLRYGFVKSRDFLNSDMKSVPEDNEFHQTLSSFVQNAEVEVMWSVEEEKRINALVKNTTDYFHGNTGKDEGLRLFGVVRDFLIILDKVCKEVKNTPLKLTGTSKKEDTAPPPPDQKQTPPPDPRQKLFPAITGRRTEADTSSSDDES